MASEKKAIQRLTSKNSKVSCHYFIKRNGEIINMVPNKLIAWHAGASCWKNHKNLNDKSIGIEIKILVIRVNMKDFQLNKLKVYRFWQKF